MKLISFVTQKGGSGKTTLAINCAVACASGQRRRVIIFDMDSQATATDWFQERETDKPQVVRVTSAELPEALNLARSQFDFVFIDTPGRDEPAQAQAIMQSDFCVIPCRPSPADLKATPATVATVKRLNKPFAFVLTQTPARSFRTAEAAEALKRMGDVCSVPIVSRTAYQDAQGLGLGVIEYEPNGRAALDTAKAWKWLSSKLK
jgi:chromosome partitioning protein